jgi:hypothetical protein
MSAEVAVVGARGFAVPVAAPGWRRDRRFFTVMAVAAMLTVFAGFAPSYYLKPVLGRPSISGAQTLSPLLHLHGLVFTTWIVLFLVQTRLIAARRIALHRRLGIAAVVVAATMVVVGFAAAVDAARRGSTPPGGPPPLVFMAIPMADLAIFSTLVVAGVGFRRRADVHKRLMLMSTISILTPAIARLPGVIFGGPLAFFALTDLFVVASLVYDRVTRGRVHPAFWWGGGLLLASQIARLAISGTGAWLAFATWLTR